MTDDELKAIEERPLPDDRIVVVASHPTPDEILVDLDWPGGTHQEVHFKAYDLPASAKLEYVTFRVTMPYEPHARLEIPLRSVTMSVPLPAATWHKLAPDVRWDDKLGCCIEA